MSSEQLLDNKKSNYNSLKQNGNHGHSHGNSDNNHAHSHNEGGHGHSHGVSTPLTAGEVAINMATSMKSGHGRQQDDDTLSINSESSSLSSGRSRVAVNCGGLNPKLSTDLDEVQEDPENAKARRKLWMASVLCCLFMVAEIVGGLFANSLAIMTDAAHLLSDLAGFLISIFALWLATRAPTSRLSFGFHRAEILGALISVLLIWLLTGVLVYEAIFRVRNPQDVDGKLMFIVASTGLGVNIALGFILHQSGHGHSHGLGGGADHGHSHGGEEEEEEDEDDEEETGHGHSHGSGNAVREKSHAHPKTKNINVTAAFIHVLGDALQSAGVMVAAGLIWYNPEWKIADPITTFIFSILVLFTTTRLIKQSIGVLMEGVPEGIDPDAVEASLAELPGVLEVHDLHIWSLSVGKPSLSVHLLSTEDCENLLSKANRLCAKRFNIHHSTIQVERRFDKIACNLN